MENQDAKFQHGPGFAFAPEDREKIVKAGQGARLMGIVLFVEAGLSLVNANIVGAAVSGVPGMFFFNGGNALKKLEFEDGHDIAHLMEGYDKLGTMFLIRLIFVAVMMAILCAAGFLIWWLISSGTLEEMIGSSF
jgi:hypothetical protein